MAYDENLAERIRELVVGESDVTEKKMFGGLAFLIGGNMAVGASGQGGVMVRVDPAKPDRLVATTECSPRRDAWPSNAGMAPSRPRRRAYQASARQVGQPGHDVRAVAAREAIAGPTEARTSRTPDQGRSRRAVRRGSPHAEVQVFGTRVMARAPVGASDN